MKKFSEILTGAVLLLLLFAVSNLLFSWVFGGVMFDATSRRRYTLSGLSEEAAAGLTQPLTMILYVSDDIADRSLAAYAAQTAVVLSRYRQAAPDKLNLEIRRVAPGSMAEKQALDDGIRPNENENGTVYLGIKFLAADGGKWTIPFLEPARHRELERDITRLLQNVENRQKIKVGLVSYRLPLLPRPGKPSLAALTSLLGEYYDLREISPDQVQIPRDTDVLLVLNPDRLSDVFAYALDQYVMRGGKVIFAIDPYSEIQHADQGYPPRVTPFMENFLREWGIVYAHDKIAGDAAGAEKTEAADGRLRSYPLWFYTAGSGSGNLHFRSPGSLDVTAGSNLTYTVLAATSEQGGYIPVEKVRYTPKSQIVLDYVQDNQKRNLALLAKGEFRSHYRDGLTDAALSNAKTPPYIPYSIEEAAVAVVADSDIFADSSWVASFDDGNPVYGTVPYAGNAAFLTGLIDRLACRNGLPPATGAGNGGSNIAENIYEKVFSSYAAEKERAAAEEAEASLNLRRLQRKGGDVEDIAYRKELQQAEDDSRNALKKLESINRRINSEADSRLLQFIIMNTIVYPFVILFLLAAPVWLRRRIKNRRGKNK